VTIEELVSFRSHLQRADGGKLMLRIDVVGEVSLPADPAEEALLLRATSAQALTFELPEGFPGADDSLAIAGMTVAFKTVLDSPEDAEDWEDVIDDFNALGLGTGESARVLAEHWPRLSEALEPWGGRFSGLASVERIAVHPALRDPAGMTSLLLRELASVLRPFEPIPFVHFAGLITPQTEHPGHEARRRARLLSELPVGYMQALSGQWTGWVIGLLEERMIQTGRDTSHWVSLRMP
jgi:hypothetical protein